jgi:hypothetical protein
LDCQGIQHHDSSNDIKLLLLPYLISDVIIFNTNSINNSTLKALEPLVSFCNFIEIDKTQKPSLIFRVKDYFLETDINNVLESNEVINEPDNGFLDSIVNILEKCSTKKMDKKYVNSIKYYIESINQNKRLDYNKLDTYTLLIKNELSEFVNNIDKELYQKIEVSDTQLDYDTKILPKLTKYTELIKSYNDKYDKVNLDLRNHFLLKMKNDIHDEIINATTQLVSNANNTVNNILKKLLNDFIDKWNQRINLINLRENLQKCKNICVDVDIISDYKKDLKQLYLEESKNIYSPVVESGSDMLDNILPKLVDQTKKFVDDVNKFIDKETSTHTEFVRELCKIKNIENDIHAYFSYENQDFHAILRDRFNDYWVNYTTNLPDIAQIKFTIDQQYNIHNISNVINSKIMLGYAMFLDKDTYMKSIDIFLLGNAKEWYDKNKIKYISKDLSIKYRCDDVVKNNIDIEFYVIITEKTITNKYQAYAKIITKDRNIFMKDEFDEFFTKNIGYIKNMDYFVTHKTHNVTYIKFDSWYDDSMENGIMRELILDKVMSKRYGLFCHI